MSEPVTQAPAPNPASSADQGQGAAKPAPATHAEAPSWTSPVAWCWLLGSVTFGLVTDIWSKYVAFDRIAGFPVTFTREQVLETTPISALIPYHAPVVVVPDLLELTLVLNPGAVFGMGAGRRAFFITFTAVAMIFAVFMFARMTTARDRVSHFAIGLLIAGGLGNLYDRIIYACVRDFLHPLPGVRYPSWTPFGFAGTEVWPYVSNIADLWLIVGIGILMIKSFRAK
jgi:signal peptidase II